MSSRTGIRSFAKRALRPMALLGASLLAMQGNAAAQRSDGFVLADANYQELPGITVEGERQRLESPRYTAPLLDTPQTITVVDEELIEQQNLLSLRDILSTLPGITFGAGEGGGGYGDSINLRGYTANNDINVDGVRDSAQYSRTDPFNLQQIEVTNGANSVYAGSGSVGGTINLVTKRPGAMDYTDITGALGTDSYGRFTLDANHVFTEGVAGRLNLMWHQNDVPGRDAETYDRWGVAPALTIGLGSDTNFTALYVHQEDENTPQYGVPYALGPFNDGPLPGVDPSDYFGYRNIDTQETQVDALTFILDHRFNDATSVRNLTRYGEVSQLSTVSQPQGTFCVAPGINPYTGAACAAPGTLIPATGRGNTRDTTNEILVNQTDFTFKFETGAIAHTLVAGVSFSEESYHLDSGNVLRNPLGATPNPALPVVDITNPDSIYTGPVNFIRTGFTDSEVSNQALYVFDRIEFTDQWELNGGVRVERSEGHAAVATIAVPYPAPPAAPVITFNPPADNEETLFSYRLGLVFKPIEDASLYLAYGNSQTPSQASVNAGCAVSGTAQNCNLDPEEAESIELGAKWDVFDGRLQLTGAIFRNERNRFRVAAGAGVEQVLDGQSRVQGAALGAAGLITDDWSIFANYTFLDSELLQSVSSFLIDGGTVDFLAGDPLPNTPEHSFSVWTTYQTEFGVMLGYGVTYNGELTFARQSAAPPLFYTDDYWVHRLMVSYDLTENATLQLNVNNVFDENYYTRIRNNATNGWATPGDARNGVVSLNYRF